MNHRFLVPTLRVLIWLLPIGVVAWILMLNLVPSGSVTLTYRQGEQREYLTGFDNPNDFGSVFRDQGEAWRPILSDQADVTVKPWRPFREITMTMRLRKPMTQINLVGVSRPGVSPRSRTVFLPELEEYRDWSLTQDSGHVLLQRQPVFPSIAEFTEHLPSENEVSTFEVDLGRKHVTEEAVSPQTKVIAQAWRGTTVFRTLVSVKNPAIRMTVRKYDLNEKVGPDRLAAFVYDEQGTVLYAQTINDDGDETVSRKRQPAQSLEISLDQIPPGEYEIELAANEEVVIESVASSQSLLYAKLRLRPMADPEHPAVLDARGRVVKVMNKSLSPETLTVNGEPETVAAQSLLRLFSEHEENRLVLSSSNLIVSAETGFALDGFIHYREPYGYPVLARAEADRVGVNYLYANYNLPEKINGDQFNVTASFTTNDLLSIDGGYRFFLASEELTNPPIAIGEVAVGFHDAPLGLREAGRILRAWGASALSEFR